MRLRYGSSYWLEQSASRSVAAYPPHRSELDVEVAIVGGGFTGCATAYIMARAGVTVALVEQARLGRGSAAASTALLMQEPDRYFTELADLADTATAETIWRRSRQAVRDLIVTLRSMRCGLHVCPSVHLARNATGARELRRDHRARRRAGLGGRLLDASALKRRTGIEGTAGILTTGNATVDPYRATLALARGAVRAGARVFEKTEALRVRGSSNGVVITTPYGTVHSKWAVVATGFATPAFKPLRASFAMATTYVIATTPVAARDRVDMGGDRIMFWNAERPYHYFRWTDDGRILFGGEDRAVPRTSRARRRALVDAAATLQRKLQMLYPQMGSISVARAWEGLFATTPDGLPYIGTHPDYPRQLFALGYGGNGMTFAFLAARVLLRQYLGRPQPADTLFGFERGRRESAVWP